MYVVEPFSLSTRLSALVIEPFSVSTRLCASYEPFCDRERKSDVRRSFVRSFVAKGGVRKHERESERRY